ncbi:hypothetical protein HKX48_007671 [Thoreauomyces humboldtii]|nr:hypothetical protein HKX48_007671 [Thoreauomyces humboldtii]
MTDKLDDLASLVDSSESSRDSSDDDFLALAGDCIILPGDCTILPERRAAGGPIRNAAAPLAHGFNKRQYSLNKRAQELRDRAQWAADEDLPAAPEHFLQRRLIEEGGVPGHPFLVAQEYVAPFEDFALHAGDLVFANASRTQYAVVETKMYYRLIGPEPEPLVQVYRDTVVKAQALKYVKCSSPS